MLRPYIHLIPPHHVTALCSLFVSLSYADTPVPSISSASPHPGNGRLVYNDLEEDTKALIANNNLSSSSPPHNNGNGLHADALAHPAATTANKERQQQWNIHPPRSRRWSHLKFILLQHLISFTCSTSCTFFLPYLLVFGQLNIRVKNRFTYWQWGN